MRSYRINVLALILSGMTACGTLPNQSALSDFGKATVQSNETFSTAISATRTLGVALNSDQNAVSFLEGGEYNVLPKQEVSLDPEAINLLRALLDSISKYAESITLAADQGNIQALEQSAANLAGAVGATASIAAPGSAAIITPSASIVGRLFGRALADNYISEVRTIMRDTHPTVVAASNHIKVELPKFSDQLKAECDKLPKNREDLLEAIKQDKRLNNLQLWNIYRDSVSELQLLLSQCAALSRFPALLDQMVASHEALLSGEIDAEAAVQLFVASVDDIGALTTAGDQ